MSEMTNKHIALDYAVRSQPNQDPAYVLEAAKSYLGFLEGPLKIEGNDVTLDATKIEVIAHGTGLFSREAVENKPSDEMILVAARTAHEVNRRWCYFSGDKTQPNWEDAPEWQKESAISGVKFHIANPGATDAASHESWLAQKESDGWVWGPNKDPEAKTHPSIRPFKDLPRNEQFKDTLFRSTVHAVLGL